MKRFPLVILSLLLSGCQPSLNKQPYFRANASSNFFKDHASARPLPDGVVPHAAVAPMLTLTPALLAQGKARYEISCAVCHGKTGNAESLLKERGFSEIPSLLSPRVRALSHAALINIMRNGKGRMPEMGSRLLPADLDGIAYYLRALELSQGALLKDLPLEDQALLKEAR